MRIYQAYCADLNRIINQHELRDNTTLQRLQYTCSECNTKLIVAAIDTRVQKPHFKSLKLYPHIEGCEYEVPEIIPGPSDHERGTARSILPNSLILNNVVQDTIEPVLIPKNSRDKALIRPTANLNPSKQRSTTKGSISEVVNGYIANPANRSIEKLTIDGVTRTYSEWFLTSSAAATCYGRLALYRLTINFKEGTRTGEYLTTGREIHADYKLYTNDKLSNLDSWFVVNFSSIHVDELLRSRSEAIEDYKSKRSDVSTKRVYIFVLGTVYENDPKTIVAHASNTYHFIYTDIPVLPTNY